MCEETAERELQVHRETRKLEEEADILGSLIEQLGKRLGRLMRAEVSENVKEEETSLVDYAAQLAVIRRKFARCRKTLSDFLTILEFWSA
jgi:hypothetical protein